VAARQHLVRRGRADRPGPRHQAVARVPDDDALREGRRPSCRRRPSSCPPTPGPTIRRSLLGILMGGDPDDPESAIAQSYTAQAAGAVSNAVLGQLEGMVKTVLSGRRPVGADHRGPATRTRRGFEIGKWLTDSLFLGYIYRMKRARRQEPERGEGCQYRIGSRWSARGVLRRPRRGGGARCCGRRSTDGVTGNRP
jgi:hypothetical protein